MHFLAAINSTVSGFVRALGLCHNRMSVVFHDVVLYINDDGDDAYICTVSTRWLNRKSQQYW